MFSVLVVSGVFAAQAIAAGATAGLKAGTPDLKSAGVLAFGPDGVLLVGDSLGAAIFAIDTGDRESASSQALPEVAGIDGKIAGLLGTKADQILINDLAVNPISGRAYLSVSRGLGPDAAPVLVRVDRGGKLSEVSLKGVNFAKASVPNVPDADAKDRRGAPQRMEAITDLAYVDERVFIAGLSNEEFSSRLRSIPFPFDKVDEGTSVEIFHGAHGRFETRSPVRTFVPFIVGGEPHLLAAYTCTPLVMFPVGSLKPGSHIKGTTVAELGNRNRPLDMVVYEKEGKDYLLLTNSSRGVMKIKTEGMGETEGITEPVPGGSTKGVPYDTITELKGVEQLDRLDEERALILVRSEAGSLDLKATALP
jgi:hypothetical protein